MGPMCEWWKLVMQITHHAWGEKASSDIAKIGWLCFPISRVDTWLLTNGHSVTIPKIAKWPQVTRQLHSDVIPPNAIFSHFPANHDMYAAMKSFKRLRFIFRTCLSVMEHSWTKRHQQHSFAFEREHGFKLIVLVKLKHYSLKLSSTSK